MRPRGIRIQGDDDRPSLLIDEAGALHVYRPWESMRPVEVTPDDLAGRTYPAGFRVRYRIECAIGGALVIGMMHEATGEPLRLVSWRGSWWWEAVGHVSAPGDVDRVRDVLLAIAGGELGRWH